MTWIDNDGTIHESMPWGVSKITSMFWGFLNIVYLFFTTLIPGLRESGGESVNYRAPRGGGGGGGGSGGYGGGNGRGPPGPPRPRGNFRSFGDMFGRGTINAGGCPGGSCGRM
ncbi:hypothetical protein ONE63_001287 [Megalurothrips usitatus]|uniref:Glycine-rich selenoprotein-like n=1 Tax=Megalurothrips usitatus TaxID=439358 RepID=A0AAV7XBQ4_9NEOP|nr:hypothetical protein ONE63_001287 [Megalurothrips usitatus]